MRKVAKNLKADEATDVQLAGWREWVSLPDLGVGAIKAKLDTGARTSALHAFAIERFVEKGAAFVKLHIHPLQRDTKTVVVTTAPIVDERMVTDSGGHREKRIVIASALKMGEQTWPIELTVTDRDSMLFRLLIGRTAMVGKVMVDPARSYLIKKPKRPPGARKGAKR